MSCFKKNGTKPRISHHEKYNWLTQETLVRIASANSQDSDGLAHPTVPPGSLLVAHTAHGCRCRLRPTLDSYDSTAYALIRVICAYAISTKVSYAGLLGLSLLSIRLFNI